MTKHDQGFTAGVAFAAELARKVADGIPVETAEHTWSRVNAGAIEALRGLADALDEFASPVDVAPPAPPAHAQP